LIYINWISDPTLRPTGPFSSPTFERLGAIPNGKKAKTAPAKQAAKAGRMAAESQASRFGAKFKNYAPKKQH